MKLSLLGGLLLSMSFLVAAASTPGVNNKEAVMTGSFTINIFKLGRSNQTNHIMSNRFENKAVTSQYSDALNIIGAYQETGTGKRTLKITTNADSIAELENNILQTAETLFQDKKEVSTTFQFAKNKKGAKLLKRTTVVKFNKLQTTANLTDKGSFTLETQETVKGKVKMVKYQGTFNLAMTGQVSSFTDVEEGEIIDGNSCNLRVDTDKDGIFDCEEVEWGTNPRVADTDGDGFLDQEELENWDQKGGNHLKFNPLIADTPRLRVHQLGKPVIQLYAQTVETGSVSKGMSQENTAEVQVTTTRGRTNVHKVEEQHTVGVNAEVAKRGPITSGKISASYGYKHTDTNTDTNYWNTTRVENNRQAVSEYYDILNSNTVTTSGGEIKVVVGLMNDGDVSYTLKNMELAAYMEDPAKPGELISVGTLRHEGNLTFTPNPQGRNAEPTGSLTPFNFVYKAENNPQEISKTLEQSNKLVLEPVNFSITGQRPDVDLNLAAQNILARTAEVIIDYGDHQGLATESFRVAINYGAGNSLSFDRLMTTHLNYNYSFGTGAYPGVDSPKSGLTGVRNVLMNTATKSYWLIAHTTTPAGSPSGARTTKLYNLLKENYTAGDLVIRRGDVLHLVYITDSDLDGISDRMERLNGTALNNSDTDSDGLDDALETYGWLTNLAAPPCDAGTNLTLVKSDPNKPDTDSNGFSDKVAFDNCSNPQGGLRVSVGDNRVVSQNAAVQLTATPANYTDANGLRYEWTQLSGVSIGALPSSPSLSFTAPDQVSTLIFNVKVTDTLANNQIANDDVRVVVVKDQKSAWFVDQDMGHDFNNTGASPDSPLRTLDEALIKAASNGGDIYLNSPDNGGFFSVDQTIDLSAGIDLYGGFDQNWQHDPEASPTPIRVAQATAIRAVNFASGLILSGLSVEAIVPPGGQIQSYAIYLENGARATLEKIIAKGGNQSLPVEIVNSGSVDLIAASSHGVGAFNISDRLEIIDSRILAGKGADGPKGVKGDTGATGATGNNGGSGNDRNGGSSRIDVRSNGAAGGKGGDAVAGAVCVGGKAGSQGTKSGNVTGGNGGSAGIAKFKVLFCEVTGAGSGSSVSTRAAKGGVGVPAPTAGFEFVGDPYAYQPSHGSIGLRGTGGAGGGSGSGWDTNDGGGGGAGGQGGGGGLGGQGGRGAGGSFALLTSAVKYIKISNSTLTSESGAAGGPGGLGGTGGSGGAGGSGADSGLRKGGSGGQGGPGGNGGEGGGGSGGPVAGLVLLNETQVDLLNAKIITGNAGNGRNPNPGKGGWNYGVYLDESSKILSDSADYQIGFAGTGAPVSACSNR